MHPPSRTVSFAVLRHILCLFDALLEVDGLLVNRRPQPLESLYCVAKWQHWRDPDF
jgi:hypothetical protein